MRQIRIELFGDRDFCGTLVVVASDGHPLFGPVPVAARASGALSAANSNPARNPRLRYGDPPTGSYRLLAHRRGGDGMHLPAAEYGRAGVLLLAPMAGEAALAEANGRYTIAISGGRPSRAGRLRPTAGGFRLSDADMRALLGVLGRKVGDVTLVCETVASSASGIPVDVDADCSGVDPLSSGDFAWQPNRRQVLMGVAGGFGLQLAGRTVVFLASASAGFGLAQAAYAPPDSSDNEPSPTDRDAFAKYMHDHSAADYKAAQGNCGKACKLGLDEGAGFDVAGHPKEAYQYGSFLQGLGFSQVATTAAGENTTYTNDYKPQPGDIAVFTKTDKRIHGHVQVWTGTEWASDFKNPGTRFSPYGHDTPPAVIYRFPGKKK